MFVFDQQKRFILHTSKKNEVVLLSTTHKNLTINETTIKIYIIEFYNSITEALIPWIKYAEITYDGEAHVDGM